MHQPGTDRSGDDTPDPGIHVSAPSSPEVEWLIGALASRRSASTIGGAEVARMVVVPPGRPRFAVPARSRHAAARSLLAYWRLRDWRTAAARLGLAVAVRSHVPWRRLGSTVTVEAPRGATSDELAALWLPEHLRQVLGHDRLLVASGLSTLGPFAKPTLQLFDGDGRPVGYAKVGWSPATKQVVAREAEVLASWPSDHPVQVPALRHAGRWQGRELSVTAPMPAGVRRVARRRWPCTDAARAIAERRPLQSRAVGEAAWVPHAEAVASTSDDPAVAAAVEAFAPHRGVEVPHAFAHGDWVPWNLATWREETYVWDWEHALDDAPLGFDLVHWAYQQHVVVQGRPPSVGFARACDDAWPHLRALGLDRAQAEAVAAAHRLRLVTREAGPLAATRR